MSFKTFPQKTSIERNGTNKHIFERDNKQKNSFPLVDETKSFDEFFNELKIVHSLAQIRKSIKNAFGIFNHFSIQRNFREKNDYEFLHCSSYFFITFIHQFRLITKKKKDFLFGKGADITDSLPITIHSSLYAGIFT